MLQSVVSFVTTLYISLFCCFKMVIYKKCECFDVCCCKSSTTRDKKISQNMDVHLVMYSLGVSRYSKTVLRYIAILFFTVLRYIAIHSFPYIFSKIE